MRARSALLLAVTLLTQHSLTQTNSAPNLGSGRKRRK